MEEIFIGFYNQLPEPYRSQAIKNFDLSFFYGWYKENDRPRNIEKAIKYGFSFSKSPQGFAYWFDALSLARKLDKQIKEKESATKTLYYLILSQNYPPTTMFYFEPENHFFDGATVYKITDSAASVEIMTDGKTWVKINQQPEQ